MVSAAPTQHDVDPQQLDSAHLQDLLDGGHAELQRAVVHEAEDVAEAGRRQPLHVDLVLVALPHVCREHHPEVVALRGQESLVGLEHTEKITLVSHTLSFPHAEWT